MSFQVLGCSYRSTPIALREQLAFGAAQVDAALAQFQAAFAETEAVLLSTCNRVELYAAADGAKEPSAEELTGFLARTRGLADDEIRAHLYHYRDENAIQHLFEVAASLDSMVLGEPQILAQVKQAYQTAVERRAAGPLLHAAFQAALHAARRVTGETAIAQRRVSIPSVAVADFAQQIFERFDDKQTLVLGAGEMAEETLRYLRAEGARDITVLNRSFARAAALAERTGGRARPWDELVAALTAADLVISATGAEEPVLRLEQYLAIEPRRRERPLFVLDLAVPRDFDAAIGERPGVYLYSVDDLQAACAANRLERDKEVPAAQRIVAQETAAFFSEIRRRSAGPVIQRLHEEWQKPKEEELRRLLNKLPDLDQHSRDEIRQAFDRLIGKLLHMPLESLRIEARHGIPSVLADALKRLFQLRD